MKRICILPAFGRSVRRLSEDDKQRVGRSLELFNSFLVTGRIPGGLGYKKIGHDTFEFRAGLQVRVIVKTKGDTYYLVIAGSHDDVRRYLRR